jgi:ferredoxin
MQGSLNWRQPAVFPQRALQALLEVLRRQDYQLIGPVLRHGAISCEPLESADQLPVGLASVQQPGRYQLRPGANQLMFGYTVGAASWKKYLFPPNQSLFRAERREAGIEVPSTGKPAPRYAFVGVRACDLEALAVLDGVFLGGKFIDPGYQQRRQQAFLLAVNCGQADETCFCVSTRSGPRAKSGFDLALTEIAEGGEPRFVVEAGTERGASVLAEVPHSPASKEDREFLVSHYEHPHWEEVAKRCLTCGNCTMVCPTCFCWNVEDVTDLTGGMAERRRKWDSCFTVDFTHIVGGSVRASVKSRYRQWLMHKFGVWQDQFGVLGCVGCGRCITWCPVGIDLTEEIRQMRKTERAPPPTALAPA